MKTHIFFSAKAIVLATTFAFIFSACDDDNDVVPNEQELITTVRLTFTSGNESLVFNAIDADGPGGNPLVVDEVNLAANTTYQLSVAFLDEQDPANAEDITEEVREESTEHLVCYEATGVPSPTGLDLDANGKTLGLKATYTTADAASGSLKVILKHEPDKDAANPCATGETDVEVTFNVVVN
ncbi:MAG: type 1 periplasmic binding fold superfamily protein [Saprospirales bacterium]|nr:type 1 periplasmic binding fold superfamily protein [Saprospirales bacterium]